MARVLRARLDRSAAISQLISEGLDVTEWTDDGGTVYEEHAHPHDEVRIVVEGGMTIIAHGVAHDLGPGDRIDLPAGEEHSARVHPSGVRYLGGTARG